MSSAPQRSGLRPKAGLKPRQSRPVAGRFAPYVTLHEAVGPLFRTSFPVKHPMKNPSHPNPVHTAKIKPTAWPVLALAAQLCNNRGEISPALSYLAPLLGRSVEIQPVPTDVLEKHGIHNQSVFVFVGRRHRALWSSGGDVELINRLGRLYDADIASVWCAITHLTKAQSIGELPQFLLEDHP